MVNVFNASPPQFNQSAMVGSGVKSLQGKLDHFAIVRRDKTGWAKQVGLLQAPGMHLGRVVLKTKVGPNKIEVAMAIGLNVPRLDTVDLLLEDDTGEHCGHDSRGAAPPILWDDVQETGGVELHAGFEAAHLGDLY